MARGVSPLVPAQRHSPRLALSRLVHRPIVIVALIIAALSLIAVTLTYISRPTQPVSIKSIAVLPFKPLGTEGRDEALELGMADTLIARLSNIREIDVRPIVPYINTPDWTRTRSPPDASRKFTQSLTDTSKNPARRLG